MAEDGLERFYGIVGRRDMYKLDSSFFDEWISGANDELQHTVQAVTPLLQKGDLYFFKSMTAERTWERVRPFAEVLSKSFGITGKPVAEINIVNSPWQIQRIGAVKLTDCPVRSILEVMLHHFSSSFLVILPEGTSDLSWSQSVLNQCDCGDILRSLSTWIPAVCEHHGTFIHLLKGCDGFSVNCISGR